MNHALDLYLLTSHFFPAFDIWFNFVLLRDISSSFAFLVLLLKECCVQKLLSPVKYARELGLA